MKLVEDHYRKNRGKMTTYLGRSLGDYDLAKDIVQEAFTRALTYFHTFDENKSSFPTWFSYVLVSACSDLLKKVEKHKSEDLSRYISLEEIDYCALVEQRDTFTKALDKHGKHRVVLSLFYLYGYSHEEIAKALGISNANSRQICHRFRTGLK